MGDNQRQVFDVSMAIPSHNVSECVDDDGRLKRTGTICTATAHIITAVIGSGVLSLAWAIAQLGWIAGPAVMLLFSFVTYYTSSLLTDCYRTGDPVSGKRNYTYTDAVRSILGGYKVKACGLIQYLNLFGISIGYTIAASISMMAIKRSNCFHESGGKNPCHMSSNPYMIMFGVSEILLSQIPDFDQIWWLSIVAAVMSFTYSGIGLGLGLAKVAATGTFKGSLTGISIGTVTQAQKIWRSLQAIGDIAFAYFAPGNLLTGFGFFNPFWLLDIANAAIIIHLVGAYQVFCQPIFAFIEKWATQRWPESYFITKEFKIPVPGYRHPYKLNMFRLVWRTGFVMLTTVISMLLPFFNDVVGILGALGFWPLTVYFPVEMYIQQKKISKWSSRWICLKMLSMACLMISIVAGAGSIVGVILDLKVYKPFKTTY
ncbi:hypothetical protein ES288_D04G041300v1 [Gossypium darwinii]|uniref:Amino acid transporter transmembrane domain-containing protein n=1 Tax=Gossypium darwinii TaxID=34276 RepID=A0A5D2CWR9_GOSDA|nr:hypothetical protein ES288_D04G041300v1 [Gossypium darwinii]